MGIHLGTDSAELTTAVSNVFIDEYMKDANGEYVKIYLYLLRCMSSNEESVSITRMADHFDHTEKDVRRALLYWEKVKLLRLDMDDEERIVGITLVDTVSMPKKKKGDKVALKSEPEKDQAVQELLFVAESLFGRLLTGTEADTILGWYRDLSLPSDVIEYLIGYCVDNRHKSIRYMDKVAISWKEKGIRTVNEAMQESQTYVRLYGRVIKAFGITGRSLVQSEIEKVKKWQQDYGFSEELIAEACARTIQTIGKASFDYADGILTNWHENGVTDMEGVGLLDQKHTSGFAAAKKKTVQSRNPSGKFTIVSQHAYDYDALEEEFTRRLMSRVED